MLVWMHRIGLPDMKLLLKTLFHSYRYLLPSRWDTVHRRRNVFFIESTLIDTLIEVCHSLPSFQLRGPAAASIIHYSSYLLYCAQLQTVWSEEECAQYSAQCAAIVTSKKNEVSDPRAAAATAHGEQCQEPGGV